MQVKNHLVQIFQADEETGENVSGKNEKEGKHTPWGKQNFLVLVKLDSYMRKNEIRAKLNKDM